MRLQHGALLFCHLMHNEPSFAGMSIAAFYFLITPCDVDMPLTFYADAAYPRFRLHSPSPVPPGDCINISITRQNPPDLSRAVLLFDSQTAWNVYTDGHHYYITFNVPPELPPLWTARVSPRADSVTVFCGDRMIDAASGRLIFNPVSYPLDQVLLMHRLAAGKGGICHAAGWHTNGQGIIFPGVSRRGKTTISRLLDQKTGHAPISDDRVVIRFQEDKPLIYGTPWPGEAGYAENAGAPLAGIFFLSHGRENKIVPISSNDAVERLLPVLSIPWYDKDMVRRMLDFCSDLTDVSPAFDLVFREDEEVVDVIERFLAD